MDVKQEKMRNRKSDRRKEEQRGNKPDKWRNRREELNEVNLEKRKDKEEVKLEEWRRRRK